MEFTAFFAGVIISGLIVASIVWAHFSSINRSLKQELTIKNRHIECMMGEINRDRKKLEKYEEAVTKTPKDCVRGEWCRACAFDKFYHIYDRTYYYCGKNEACPHLTYKQNAKNDTNDI